MKPTIAALLAALLATTATGHMEMRSPAPLNSKHNPNTNPSSIDYSMTSPLRQDGSDYPCKNYHHSLLGTPAGRPTATLVLGAPSSLNVVGGAVHGGGSCQVSLSTDEGRTFTVLKSIVGGCPAGFDTTIDFTVPADAPEGDALLAWSWNNRIGNREMYMNCASVTLIGGDGEGIDKAQADADVPYSSRPAIFVANVANGCSVAEGGDVVYPEPGPDVVQQSTNPIQPVGDCGGGSSEAAGGGEEDDEDEEKETPKDRKDRKDRPTLVEITPHRTPPAYQPIGSRAPPPEEEEEGEVEPPVPTGSSSAPACTREGVWECLTPGTTFRRCVAGTWSAVLDMPPGTVCEPGVKGDLEMVAVL